jgi:hypothetical protein
MADKQRGKTLVRSVDFAQLVEEPPPKLPGKNQPPTPSKSSGDKNPYFKQAGRHAIRSTRVDEKHGRNEKCSWFHMCKWRWIVDISSFVQGVPIALLSTYVDTGTNISFLSTMFFRNMPRVFCYKRWSVSLRSVVVHLSVRSVFPGLLV